jgi:hypothetical protein
MKLIHGIASWRLGREISLHLVEFSFASPRHVADYAFLYPGEERFDAGVSVSKGQPATTPRWCTGRPDYSRASVAAASRTMIAAAA